MDKKTPLSVDVQMMVTSPAWVALMTRLMAYDESLKEDYLEAKEHDVRDEIQSKRSHFKEFMAEINHFKLTAGGQGKKVHLQNTR